MAVNFAIQPDAKAPAQRAKHLLRVERYAEIDGLGTVPIASSLTGAPLAHVDVEVSELAVKIGDLALTCDVVRLTDEETVHTAGRYITRHGAPHAKGDFAFLVPKSASLGGEQLDPAVLLTEGDGKLMSYERSAVDHMNDDHLDAVKNYAEVLLGAEQGEWRLASLDMEGLDLVRCDDKGTDFRRLWFHPPLAAPGEIKSKLVELAMAGRAG